MTQRPTGTGLAALLLVCLVGAAPCAATDITVPKVPDTPGMTRTVVGFAKMLAAAEQEKAQAVGGRDGWLFLAAELRYLTAGKFWGPEAAQASRATRPEVADPLPAIVDFGTQLEKLGIELIVAPVPAKAAVYAGKALAGVDAAPEDLAYTDPYLAEFLTVLGEHGVGTLVLNPVLVQAKDHAKGPVYCKTDTHWSGVACVLAAQAIAEKLKMKPYVKAAPTLETQTEWRATEIRGDLAEYLPAGTPKPGPETLQLRYVGTKGPFGLDPVKVDAESPVLVLGDSHTLVFHAGGRLHAKGAGLSDQLAAELGIAIDLLGTKGSGATPARINLFRRTLRDRDYFNKKKAIVWVFAVREFTEAMQGWDKVPMKP